MKFLCVRKRTPFLCFSLSFRAPELLLQTTAPRAGLLSAIHLTTPSQAFTEHRFPSNKGNLLLHSCRAQPVTSCRFAANITIKGTNVKSPQNTRLALKLPCLSKPDQGKPINLSPNAHNSSLLGGCEKIITSRDPEDAGLNSLLISGN